MNSYPKNLNSKSALNQVSKSPDHSYLTEGVSGSFLELRYASESFWRLQVASGILDELTVLGDDWPTPDGTCIRDYIHVMDLAEGHIAALDYLNNFENKIINLNLGTGLGTSVLELIDTFEKVNNIKISKNFSGRRIGDSCTLIADNCLALSCLNWSPKRDLEEMCLDGWKWQSLNPEGYQ